MGIAERDGDDGGKRYEREEDRKLKDAPRAFDRSDDGSAIEVDGDAVLIERADPDGGAGHGSLTARGETGEQVAAGSRRGCGRVGFKQPDVG